MEDTNITKRLKAIRLALQLNQKEFGERMGMALTTWASIEQGRNSLNERARLLLEKIYFVNPDYLDSGQGPMFLRTPRPPANEFIAFYNKNMQRANLDAPAEKTQLRPDPEDPVYSEQGIRFSMAHEEKAQNFNMPCPDCYEKDREIFRLQQMINRLENEVEHQRKIIDHLMDIQKNQNRPR